MELLPASPAGGRDDIIKMKRRKAKKEMFRRILKYVLGGIVFVGIVFAIALYVSIYNPNLQTKAAESEKAKISGTAPTVLFEKTYSSSPNNNGPYDAYKTSDGGFIILSGQYDFSSGAQSIWVIKTDKDGGTCDYSVVGECFESINRWVKKYKAIVAPSPSLNIIRGNSIKQTNDGGYIIAGFINDGNANSLYRWWVLKTDSSGNTCNYISSAIKGNCSNGISQWSKTYNSYNPSIPGGASSGAEEIIQTSDGGYAVSGSYPVSSNTSEARLLKLNSSGIIASDNRYAHFDPTGLPYYSTYFGSLSQVADGGYMLSGVINSNGSPMNWTIKTNSSGTTCNYFGATNKGICSNGSSQWARVYTSEASGLNKGTSSVTSTRDGGAIVVVAGGDYEMYVQKVNSSGDKVWQKKFLRSSQYEVNFADYIEETIEGNYVFSYGKQQSTNGKDGLWLAKIDLKGVLVWENKIRSGLETASPFAFQINEGSYIIISDKIVSGLKLTWLAKTQIDPDSIIIPPTYTYTDNYNYSDQGILVYTSAVELTRSDATVEKGQNITYKLTVTNPHWDKKAVNLKFVIPKDFSYQGGVTCQNITPCPNPSQAIGKVGIADLTWVAVNVPAGESSISFKLRAP